MILAIDTASSSKVLVKLLSASNEEVGEICEETYFGSQTLLPSIIKLIKAHKISLKEISEIKLNMGPGSYTGLKVGAAVANALAFTLNIPVNKKASEVDLIYT